MRTTAPEPDEVALAQNLAEFMPDVEEIHLASGHWIQQEKPEETNRTILEWLARHDATAA